MKALVAAGGHGTRMRPITYTQNKHLIPVANKPMIFFVFENIASAGIRDVAVNINPDDKEIMKAIGDGSRWNLNITYIEQRGGALGLAHVVKNAHDYLGDDDFMFYLGDNILRGGGVKEMVDDFYKQKVNCMLALTRVRDPQRFGVAEIDGNGKLISIVEKPKQPKSDLAVAGIYIYDKNIFEAVSALSPSARGEYEISDAHQYLLTHGFSVGYREITGWWKDTGQPYDLLEGNQLILNEITPMNHAEIVDENAKIQGKVQIGTGTRILGKCILRGPLVVGENCTLNDCYLGPYTAVGNNVALSNVEVEHSIILDDSRLSCRKRIVDSIIGKNVKIDDVTNSYPSGYKLIVGDSSSLEL